MYICIYIFMYIYIYIDYRQSVLVLAECVDAHGDRLERRRAAIRR